MRELDAGDLAADAARRAGRDQDLFGGDRAVPVSARQRVRVDDPRARLDDLDARRLEELRVTPVQPRDLLVLVRDQSRPVELRLADRPAVAGRVLEVVGEVAGVDEELLRDAAADHAGAAERTPRRSRRARRAPRDTAARTPPEPAPITNRSKSNSVIRYRRGAQLAAITLHRVRSCARGFFISARNAAMSSSETSSCPIRARAQKLSEHARQLGDELLARRRAVERDAVELRPR